MLKLTLLCICVGTICASSAVPIKKFGPRIVNGEDAIDGQFPWQVAIIVRSATIPEFLCGGALISDQWVLTAGHCIDGILAATVYSGAASMSSSNMKPTEASDFILHQNYNETYYYNDIGLVKLATPLSLNENIQPIALSEDETAGGVNVTISGFGSLSDSDPNIINDILQYASVTTIGNIECEGRLGYVRVTSGTICTIPGSPVISPCLGDSGGPLVSYEDDEPKLVGIFIFGNQNGCETDYPAAYTRTAYYVDWIWNNTGIGK